MANITIKVYLQPKASRNEIAGTYRDGIKIRITAPPIEGKANEALLRFLATSLDLPPSQVEILKGHHSREKLLRLANVDLSLVTQRLQAFLK